MAKVVHNAQVYNSEGSLVFQGDLYTTSPAGLRDGTYYVLSELVGGEKKISVPDLQSKSIARIINGEFRGAPHAVWVRNYNPRN